jgi:hypothetical protein
MAVSKALQRLLRILNLEEEMHRRELDAAQRDQALLTRALTAAGEQERRGRQLTTLGAERNELPDRLAGLEEVHAGGRRAIALQLRLAQASQQVSELRAAFLSKRVERRQAETLVDHAEEREVIEANRRAQQSLDDWYLTQKPDDTKIRDAKSVEPQASYGTSARTGDGS